MFAVEARVPEMTKESQAFFILSPFTTWTDSRAAGAFVLGPEAAMLAVAKDVGLCYSSCCPADP